MKKLFMITLAIVAGVTFTQEAYAAKRKRRVDYRTKCTIGDVIRQNDVGVDNAIPADPNTAVGPETLVTMVNSSIAIHDKKTGERLSLTPEEVFFNVKSPTIDTGRADPVITYDHFSERFIALIWENNGFGADAELIVEMPDSIAGTYPGSKGSNVGSEDPFDLSGLEIVPAMPLNADTPLTNDLTGKIALIASDQFVTTSANKSDNAAAAGAVAAIIYNSELNELINIFGSNFIPTISVGKEIGEAMLANASNPGVIGGMRSTPEEEVGLNSFSRMYVAVSNDSAPRLASDFNTYVVGDPTFPYKNLLADYPRVGIDEDAIYIGTNSFQFPETVTPEGSNNRGFSQVVAVEKAPLINGIGSPPCIVYNDLIEYPFNTTGAGSAGNQLRVPTVLRTPKTNSNQVSFFVNAKLYNPIGDVPQVGDTLVVTAVKDILGTPQTAEFEVKVEPWTAPVQTAPGGIRNINIPQPNGVLQEPPFSLPRFQLNTIASRIMYRCVQYKDSLLCCHTVGGPDVYEVRWYELDVSKIFDANNPTVTLKQQGAIRPGGTTSAFYPSIDVDKDGNIAIGFNIAGPDTPLAFAHTGRLANDPAGTVRFPLQLNFMSQPDLPYFNTGLQPATFASRWNDYTSVDLDPTDGKTFYFSSQYSNQNEEAYVNFFTEWTTGLVSFCVEELAGAPCSYPGQEGDGNYAPKAPARPAAKALAPMTKEEFLKELEARKEKERIKGEPR